MVFIAAEYVIQSVRAFNRKKKKKLLECDEKIRKQSIHPSSAKCLGRSRRDTEKERSIEIFYIDLHKENE